MELGHGRTVVWHRRQPADSYLQCRLYVVQSPAQPRLFILVPCSLVLWMLDLFLYLLSPVGYIIGMETAIGSFVLGKSIARKFHQIVNPILAAEAEAAKERQAEGVYLNRDLPDFERRYLPDLDMGSKGEKNYGEFLPLGRLDGLESWRRTTKDARRVNHPQLDLLKRIEQTVLVDGLPIPPDTVTYARSYGWDLDALDNWVASKRGLASRLPSLTSQSMIAMPEESRWLQPTFASALLGVVIMSLLLLLVMLNGKRAYTITNRTMVYAMLWAPAGALLRWKLSALNGKLKVDGWTWFPLGTFLANLLGSIVSIIAIAGEYDMGSVYDRTFFWDVGSIRAVKVGFAGSLTTVSTFVAEINGFMRKSDHAYPYILSTIASCSIVASIIYGSMLLLWKN
jgi:fluoride ion exporter CrcB/FEX